MCDGIEEGQKGKCKAVRSGIKQAREKNVDDENMQKTRKTFEIVREWNECCLMRNKREKLKLLRWHRKDHEARSYRKINRTNRECTVGNASIWKWEK